MAITLWKEKNPLTVFESLKKEMDRWFNETFPRGIDKTESVFDERGLLGFPAVDIQEKEDKYIVKAELPGMKKDDINVEFHNGRLVIKGEKRFEHEDKKEDFHRIETYHGSFHRSFDIPESVKEEDIKAEYKNGILELTLPVEASEKKKRKKIQIR